MPETATLVDWGLLILRIGLGILFIPHGWMKLNPQGPTKGPGGFAGFLRQLGVPAAGLFAWVVALLETVGALLLIVGLATRWLALAFVIDMLVAIRQVKIKMAKQPFMNPQGAGWEFEFILLVAALALLFTGAGSLSLDRVLGFGY